MQFQSPALRQLIVHGIAALSFPLLWLSFLTFPTPTPQALDIDGSWQLVLAHAFQHSWQAGVDYIFTYGPLGYFALKNPNYEANLFSQTVLWGMISSFCLSSIFLACWYNLSQQLEKFLYLGLLIIVIPELSHFSDAWYFLGMMGTTLLLLQPPPFLAVATRHGIATGVALLGLALLSLTKFNFLMLAVVCVTGIVLVGGQRYSLKTAALLLISFIVIFLGSWLACQQSLGNLPTFLLTAWQLSSHYGEAMSTSPNPTAIWLALGTMSITSLLVIINSFAKPLELARIIAGGIILVGLFLSWKGSFVRSDAYHFPTFFSVALIAPFLLPSTPSMGGTRRSSLARGLLWINVLVAMVSVFYLGASYSSYTVNNFISLWYKRVVHNTTTLWSLDAYKNANDQIVAQRRQQYAIPNIRAAVGKATIDMFPPVQSIIFYNNLNYQPRPIFQGYAAYTERALEINGNFYAHPQTAPQFIIFNLDVIDNRFPMLEDSNALTILRRDYQPRFAEKGLLLLEHQPRAGETTVNQPLFSKVVKLGEKVALTPFSVDKQLFLSLDIRKSMLGQLTTLLFQLPAIILELTTIDGAVLTYRLLPSIANRNFLVNPLLLDQSDWLKWHHGQPLKRVAAVRVLISEDLQPLFQPMVTVKVTASGKGFLRHSSQ